VLQARLIVSTTSASPERKRIARTWLRLRGARHVAVPFAEELAKLVPTNAVRMRRDFKKLLTLIQAHTLLFQLQRELTEDGAVIATLDDYAIVRELVAPTFDAVLGDGLTTAIRETVEAVPESAEISLAHLTASLSGLNKSTVSRRLNRAIAGGWLVNHEQRKGHPARVSRGTPMPAQRSALPTVDELREALRCCTPSGGDKAPSHSFEDSDDDLQELPF